MPVREIKKKNHRPAISSNTFSDLGSKNSLVTFREVARFFHFKNLLQ